MKNMFFSNKKINESKKLTKNLIQYKIAKKNLRLLDDKNIINKKIVFNTVKPFFNFLHRELFLGYILAKLGAEVYYLIDESGVFFHWDTVQKHNERYTHLKNGPRNSFFKYHFYYKPTIDVYNHKNIHVIDYSKIIDDRDKIKEIATSDEYKTRFNKYAEASTRRYSESGEMDLNDKKQKEYYDLSLCNSYISLESGKYIDKILKPDIFITSHGIYSIWGPCYDYLSNTGYTSLIYGAYHQIPQRIYISEKIRRIANQSIDWKNFQKTELTKEMAAKVDAFLNNRIEHKSSDNIEHFSLISENADFNIEEIENFKYVLCAFPNVIWDADIEEINVAFNGVLDWLLKTINFLKNKEEIMFIIRCHPSEETVLKGTKKVEDLLNNKIEYIHEIENIKIIPSSANVDTYNFLKKYVDVGLAYDGTLGIEMPYIGIPTLMAGRGRFNNKHINLGVETIEEYYDYIGNPEKIISDFKESFDRDTLYKYIYWQLYEQNNYFPILDSNKANTFDLNNLTLSNIDVFQNKDFRKTIEKIIGEPLIF